MRDVPRSRPGCPGRVADHVEPHRGDPNLFWNGQLQSLCFECHDSRKVWIERRGYLPDVDPETGYPLDPAHPFNASRWDAC
jgi:5-methylcytosine-specific restriction enzyme A